MFKYVSFCPFGLKAATLQPIVPEPLCKLGAERPHAGRGPVRMLPDGAHNGEEIGPRLNQRRGISGGNAADRDAGHFHQFRPPAENLHIRAGFRLLRAGRVEGPEGDVVGPLLDGSGSGR